MRSPYTLLKNAVCSMNFVLPFFPLLVFTPNEAVVLYVDLMPQGIGSLTYYLPVLVAENQDALAQN